MFKKLLSIIIIFMLLTFTGCSLLKSTGSSAKGLVKKTKKAKYLTSNNIEIKQSDRSIDTSNGAVTVSKIEINGLKDRTVQEKLNKSINEDIESEVKDYIGELGQSFNAMFSSVDLNANSILSVKSMNYFTLESGPENPAFCLLYDLNDGKRLYLKDIFTSGTDYVALLNSKINLALVGGRKSEENMLREPFTTIREDQDFALTPSKLYIIFKKGEGGFAERNSVEIPLSEIDDYVDILDMYKTLDDSRRLPDTVTKRNNIFVDYTGKVVKEENPKILAYYPVISGLNDKHFEKSINDTINSLIKKIMESREISNFKTLEKDPYRNISISAHVSFNHYGFLSIGTFVYSSYENINLQNFNTVSYCTFDLINKKRIDSKDILMRYAERHEDFKESLVNYIKNNMDRYIVNQYGNISQAEVEKIKSKIDFPFIINNANVSFFNSEFQNYPGIIISFKEKSILRNDKPLEYQFALKDILKTSIQDFFEE